MPSASVKSNFPFKNALLVNSPGSANWKCSFARAFKIDVITARPPWTWNSIQSSPVNELGPKLIVHI